MNYAYDATGRLTDVTGSEMQVSSLLTGLQYRASGALKHAAYGDATQLNLSYDEGCGPLVMSSAMSRMLSRILQWWPRWGAKIITMLTAVRYARDLQNGNFDRGYSYDQVGRLQEATSGREARGEAPATPADSPYKQNFTYDVWGNQGRTARLWTGGQTDAPTYSNNRRGDWYYDAAGNALLSSQGKTHSYDATGQQVNMYEEVWSGPAENWVFHQNTIVPTYDGGGQPGKRVETRHTEDINGVITNEVKTAYYVRSSVLGGASITEIDQLGGQMEAHVYVGSEKVADFSGPAPDGWMLFRHANQTTGNWVSVRTAGYGERTEVDPLGAVVGITAPPPSASYSDLIGNNWLYEQLGNPFDMGGGCGRLAGMPVSCSDLRKNGSDDVRAEALACQIGCGSNCLGSGGKRLRR